MRPIVNSPYLLGFAIFVISKFNRADFMSVFCETQSPIGWFLAVPRPKALKFALLVFSPIWFSTLLFWVPSFTDFSLCSKRHAKAYENEKTITYRTVHIRQDETGLVQTHPKFPSKKDETGLLNTGRTVSTRREKTGSGP